jgi:putative flippase GtrA
MALNNKLFKQIMCFGIIGTTAAFVNFSLVVLLVEIGSMQPLYANMIAFIFAFQVSYFGHRYWTFQDTTTNHSAAVPRLLIVAGSNFFANMSLFYFFLNSLHLPYTLALLLVMTILPIITFTFGKFWVFR